MENCSTSQQPPLTPAATPSVGASLQGRARSSRLEGDRLGSLVSAPCLLPTMPPNEINIEESSEGRKSEVAETNLHHRSGKKAKRDEHALKGDYSGLVIYDHEYLGSMSDHGEDSALPKRASYKSMLMECNLGMADDGEVKEGGLDLELENEVISEGESDPDGIQVVDVSNPSGGTKTIIRLNGVEHNRIVKPWRRNLLLHLLGRKIGFKALEKRLQQLWPRVGSFQLVDLGSDYFMVQFKTIKAKEWVMNGGPWMVFDCYLLVREWEP